MADSFNFLEMGDNSCMHGTVTLSNHEVGPADIEYLVEDTFGRFISVMVTIRVIE